MSGNANFSFTDVAIVSIEAVDAPEIITSAQLDERLAPFYERTGATPGLLESLAGIKQRRQWPEGVTFMEAAATAGKQALEAAGIDKSQIGLLMDSSVCRARLEPSSAVTVHDTLGMPSTCLNFDISNACLGFLNGMHVAGSMLEAGIIDYALIVDGEDTRQIHNNTITKLLDPNSTIDDLFANFASLTLGSGAAAAVLGRHSENPGSHQIKGGFFRADTRHHELCVGSLDGMTTDTRALLEAGTEVAKYAWEDAGDKEGWYDMKYYVLHQISQVHTQAVIDTLGIDGNRVPRSFPTMGNVGPAAIPITLASLTDDLEPGDGVMLQGMGSGINAAIVEILW